jgi:CarD family transcriptional regulator
MYQIGDTVMHPSEGVCAIEDIRPIRFSDRPAQDYYVLRPSLEKGSGTVYLPIERGNAILRRLLSHEDILGMIHESPSYAGLWADDSRTRKDRFAAILNEGNYAKIIQMIREIHEHSALRLAEGKKLSVNDEHILNDAQRILHQEFSYVLKKSPEETVAFILRELGIA